MKRNTLTLLDAFSSKTVLVLGDVILDSYLEGKSNRLCREAPVPIVDIYQESRYPGGAANTAVNVAAMGADCLLFSCVGTDASGYALIEQLNNDDVNTHGVITIPGRKTLFKQRLMAENQLLARIDQGSTDTLTEDRTERLANLIEEHCRAGDVDAIIISDYGYGTITPSMLARLAAIQVEFGYPLIIDAKDLTRYTELNATAVTPNYAEAVAILGEPMLPTEEERKQQILELGSLLLRRLNSQIVVVTLDRLGAIVFEQGNIPRHILTTPCTGTVGGAGDTFIAAFTLALCGAGATAEAATALGVKAATITVSLPGTGTCTDKHLRQSLLNEENVKLLDSLDLNNTLDLYRIQGATIVFTNGCFDLLHNGHLDHLREAAAQGHILVVGLNTDESVQRLKGDSRPIHSFSERAALLGALEFVDFIVPLADDNPIELVKEVRPDIFVKGGDYAAKELPESLVVKELGGEVRILPFHNGYSTTQLIERIRAM